MLSSSIAGSVSLQRTIVDGGRGFEVKGIANGELYILRERIDKHKEHEEVEYNQTQCYRYIQYIQGPHSRN